MLRFIFWSLFLCVSVFSCPDDSFEWQSNCYIFNRTATEFEKAEEYCIQRGGHLMSIHDAFTNDIIRQNAPSFLPYSSDFWIGANSKNHVWGWTDGSNFDFNDWDKGEPQNSTEMNCASFSIKDGYWSAKDCFTLKTFVCEVISIKNCTSGWTYYQQTNSYYCGYFDYPSLTWQEGEDYCKNFAGHLSSIHSYEESRLIWVTSGFFCNNSPWIGLYTDNNGTTFHWSDGSNVDYLNWGECCPNMCGGTCTCTIIMGSDCRYDSNIVMKNSPCSATQNFVCKKS